MRIAIVRQKYNPYGGAERFIERALGALRATGSAELCVIGRAWTQKPASFRRWPALANPVIREMAAPPPPLHLDNRTASSLIPGAISIFVTSETT